MTPYDKKPVEWIGLPLYIKDDKDNDILQFYKEMEKMVELDEAFIKEKLEEVKEYLIKEHIEESKELDRLVKYIQKNMPPTFIVKSPYKFQKALRKKKARIQHKSNRVSQKIRNKAICGQFDKGKGVVAFCEDYENCEVYEESGRRSGTFNRRTEGIGGVEDE